MDRDSQRIFFSSTQPATAHCFDFSRRSLRAAEIQVNRIWSHPQSATDDQDFFATIQDILTDVHFYFIALRNLYRHLEKVVKDPIFTHLKPELDALNERWFKNYAKGRESFEHIDQRLPEEKHSSKLVEVTENGASRKVHYGISMQNAVFTHSDLTLDISIENFQCLKENVNALIAKILDSCPPDPFEQPDAM